jgi:hypothetical protein
MKSLLRLPKRLARRYAYVPIISAIDRLSDENAEPDASGIVDGFMKTTIDEFLECPGLTERLQQSELRRLPEDGSRILLDWDVPAFVWQAVLTSKRLQEAVRNYIGPNVRLDDLYLKNVLDGLAVGSGGWHDDNVGYRLKVFMVFDTEGSPAGTVIIPSKRPRIYEVRLKDELNRLTRSTTQEHRDGEVLVNYTPGDCLIFDTNIPHRGDYTGGPGVRYCLIAEFIDRDKANRIYHHAPCGPGQGSRRILIPGIPEIKLEDQPLIDESLLSLTADGHEYGHQKT